VSDDKLKIKVTADTKTATNNITKMDNSLAKTVKSVIGLGAAFLVVKKSYNFLKESTKMAIEQEEVFNKLEGAVELLGISYTNVEDELNNLFTKLQETTKYGDDETARAFANMASKSGDYEESLKNMSLATDFATDKQVDLYKASSLIGRAMKGEITALKLLIPSIADLDSATLSAMTATEKSKFAIEAIRKQYGGLAANELNTTTGALSQFKNYWGDVREAMGDAFTPAIRALSIGMIPLMADLEEYFSSDAFKEFSKDTANKVTGIIKDLPKQWDKVKFATSAAGLATGGFFSYRLLEKMGKHYTAFKDISVATSVLKGKTDILKATMNHWNLTAKEAALRTGEYRQSMANLAKMYPLVSKFGVTAIASIVALGVAIVATNAVMKAMEWDTESTVKRLADSLSTVKNIKIFDSSNYESIDELEKDIDLLKEKINTIPVIRVDHEHDDSKTLAELQTEMERTGTTADKVKLAQMELLYNGWKRNNEAIKTNLENAEAYHDLVNTTSVIQVPELEDPDFIMDWEKIDNTEAFEKHTNMINNNLEKRRTIISNYNDYIKSDEERELEALKSIYTTNDYERLNRLKQLYSDTESIDEKFRNDKIKTLNQFNKERFDNVKKYNSQVESLSNSPDSKDNNAKKLKTMNAYNDEKYRLSVKYGNAIEALKEHYKSDIEEANLAIGHLNQTNTIKLGLEEEYQLAIKEIQDRYADAKMEADIIRYQAEHTMQMGFLDLMVGSWTDASNLIFNTQMTGSQKWEEIGRGLLNSTINMLGSMTGEWIKNLIVRKLVSKAAAAEEVATAVATGSAIALAYSNAAVMTSLATFGTNSVAAIAGMTAASVAGRALAIPSFSNGGDFIVPQGYSNDSYPMLVESGEHVKVTPNGGENSTDMLLSTLIGVLRDKPVANTVVFDDISMSKYVDKGSSKRVQNW